MPVNENISINIKRQNENVNVDVNDNNFIYKSHLMGLGKDQRENKINERWCIVITYEC